MQKIWWHAYHAYACDEASAASSEAVVAMDVRFGISIGDVAVEEKVGAEEVDVGDV